MDIYSIQPPAPPRIGQWVRVKEIAIVGYFGFDETENDRTLKLFSVQPFDAVITGQTVKLLGRYRKESNFDGEYEPACLLANGSVTLWLVRNGLRGKEYSVKDFEIIGRRKLPLRGQRLIYEPRNL